MDEIKKFFEKLGEDEALQARVKAEVEVLEGDEKLNKIVEIAKELGFNFTVADFNAAKTELSEEDLDAVAGGNIITDAFDWVKDKVKKGAEIVDRLLNPNNGGSGGGNDGGNGGGGTTINQHNTNTNSNQQNNVEGNNSQNDVVLQNK